MEDKPSPLPWHHAPPHRFDAAGTYMITAATFQKAHRFKGSERLDMLMEALFRYATEYEWQLQAWALFPNHYHFIAVSPAHPKTLARFLNTLHMKTARAVNQMDGTPGRRVWFQYWDSQITFTNSYWPRLRYVHENAVHHGIVPVANQYRWCSARWFEETAEPTLQRKLMSYAYDKIRVSDHF